MLIKSSSMSFSMEWIGRKSNRKSIMLLSNLK